MPDRLPIDQMPGLLRQPHPEIPLGEYVHTRTGKTYYVVGGTFLATGDDQQVFVQYVCPVNGYSAHRTAADFLHPVPHPYDPAIQIPRFQLIRTLPIGRIVPVILSILRLNGDAAPPV